MVVEAGREVMIVGARVIVSGGMVMVVIENVDGVRVWLGVCVLEGVGVKVAEADWNPAEAERPVGRGMLSVLVNENLGTELEPAEEVKPAKEVKDNSDATSRLSVLVRENLGTDVGVSDPLAKLEGVGVTEFAVDEPPRAVLPPLAILALPDAVVPESVAGINTVPEKIAVLVLLEVGPLVLLELPKLLNVPELDSAVPVEIAGILIEGVPVTEDWPLLAFAPPER